MSDDDKTPPQITTGSFVSWANGKGRVDLVVRKGKVPGIDSDVEATEDSPAARVVVWKDGKATDEKIAASTHTLKRIAPLDGSTEGKSGVTALVALQGQHAEHVVEGDEMAHLSADALMTAYDRGVKAWPGPTVTTLTSDEWAVGRAEHLCKAARGEVETTNDFDLLHPQHPVAIKALTERAGDDAVVITAADMEADLARVTEGVETPE